MVLAEAGQPARARVGAIVLALAAHALVAIVATAAHALVAVIAAGAVAPEVAGSLVVGLLDLFASHGQGRFYRELEEWLSSITKIGLPGMEGDEGLNAGNVLAVLEQSAAQIDGLRQLIEQGAARAVESDARVAELAAAIASPEARAAEHAVMERIALAQERVAELLAARDEDAGRLDAETRSRLRSIDTQVLRILEDLAAGRQEMVTEMRQELAALTDALRGFGRGRV